MQVPRKFSYWIFLVLVSLLAAPVIAQDRITVDTDIAVTVSDATPQITYLYSGQAGQSIKVDLTALTPGMAPLFFVSAPDGTLVRANGNPDALAVITDTFSLTASGDFSITVGSWNQIYGTLALRVSIAQGQAPSNISGSCPALVDNALDLVSQVCSPTGRNQACLGNLQVQASFKPTALTSQFQQVGDIANVSDFDSLQISPMNLNNGTWGVALLRIQANLPDTQPGQNVTMLVFGDVQLQNAGDASASPTLTGFAKTNLNARTGPGTGYSILEIVGGGEQVTIEGRTGDYEWARLQRDSGTSAWVVLGGLNISGDPSTLPVLTADEPVEHYGPMQAFYFRSGIGDAPCVEAPNSGILIQTPKGANRVDLLMNEVQVSLGSTAFISAQPNNSLVIGTLEGEAIVTAQGGTQSVPAGTQVQVLMDANLKPIQPPLAVEPLNPELVRSAPVKDLPEPVVIPPSIQPPAVTSTPEGIVLPTLSTTGTCVLATLQAVNVNIRSGPGLDFATVGGGMDPQQIYNIIGRTGDSSWWQINQGWVSGEVTRRGGDCSQVPVTYIPPSPTPIPTLIPTTVPTLSGPTMEVYHTINSVQTQVNGNGPYEITITVNGQQNDGCVYPVQRRVEVSSGSVTTIYVDIYRDVPENTLCTSVIIPYQATFSLGSNFSSGSYLIDVNQFTVSLNLG